MSGSQDGTARSLLIRRLSSKDAAHLAPLLNAYRAEMYPASQTENLRQEAATALLSSQTAEVIGGFLDGKLSAFAVFFDLPEAISNARAGQLDDLYVAAGARGQRLAQEMVQAVALIGKARGWVHLRWLVPEDNAAALRTYERFAKAASWKSYVLWLGDGGSW
ncbi:MAG: GNAT family N-acetyltransferase [Rhizobiaceae bacterium]|nr:GNAT family N-acetyltransferase [Rhizobiaceae bacterium]